MTTLLWNATNYTVVSMTPVSSVLLDGKTDLEIIRDYCTQYATWETTMLWSGVIVWTIVMLLGLLLKRYPSLEPAYKFLGNLGVILYAATFFAILGARVFA